MTKTARALIATGIAVAVTIAATVVAVKTLTIDLDELDWS